MQSNGSSRRYASPLRYPGGKGKIANFLKILIIQNDLSGVRYVEPYAGGASIALSLLFEGYVSQVHINDLNRGLHAFWNSVLTCPDRLCAKITSAPLSMEEWEKQRNIYLDPDTEGIDLAFSTFYLNRTNRSGIISGGVIGGNEQTGQWKIDARFNRESLVARVNKIAERAPDITLSMLDAIDLIKKEKQTRQGGLLYLDPPYYFKGARLYDNFYTHEDHVKVSHEIQIHPGPWVVSYDAVPEIMQLYEQCNSTQYFLNYSAAKADKGMEVMFFSKDLSRPDVPSPAGITLEDVRRMRRRLMSESG
ncbi:DNA adenine methylase [Actinomadura syzygii]|uniref:DNA adenine methylase n=1 Tax=Actinomadura syzygii TaxID=1427538 RepID=UPI001CA36466|nr:DNA adenine methylase [Actinomadura syzygii]